MKVAEFRDIVDSVFDVVRSFQSATRSEREAEACRVQKAVRELRECQWPKRLSDKDRERALRALDQANAAIAAVGVSEPSQYNVTRKKEVVRYIKLEMCGLTLCESHVMTKTIYDALEKYGLTEKVVLCVEEENENGEFEPVESECLNAVDFDGNNNDWMNARIL